MDWEERFCPESRLRDRLLAGAAIPNNDALWHLSDRFGDGTFTIAAADPRLPALW